MIIRLNMDRYITFKIFREHDHAKERAWNNLNNYGTGFLFLTKQSQEAHSYLSND